MHGGKGCGLLLVEILNEGGKGAQTGLTTLAASGSIPPDDAEALPALGTYTDACARCPGGYDRLATTLEEHFVHGTMVIAVDGDLFFCL
jgi:hypothetical protein